jgi:4-aminobutyrate aminotransferase-like enzyme
MVALELVKAQEGDGRAPDAALAKRVLAGALARRLMLLSAGPYGNVVRIIPPLVTTAEEVDLALRILDEALAEATTD